VEYVNFGGEFQERHRKVIMIGVALSIDESSEGRRKTRLLDVGSKRV